jgi:CMP-N,N'-diacetyllegionaminic acid synthase
MKKEKIIAIIPARSGSKSIKDKNILRLKNKSLIAWAIESCIKSKVFFKIYLSTDSIKYAKIAKKYKNVEVIIRPKKISKDFSTDYEMINHAMNTIKEDYELIAHIRPTSPLRKTKDIKSAIKSFINTKNNSLRSVHEMSESSYKSVEIKKGLLSPLANIKKSLDEINLPRQNFNKTYSPNGIIDIYRKNFVLKHRKLFGKRVKAFITDYSQEVDNMQDFRYIEYLCKKKL